MALQGFQRIGRTTGLEPAGIAQPGLEQETVPTHQQKQSLLWQFDQVQRRHAAARAKSCSSSARAALHSAVEAADGNNVGLNGARKRTSQSPGGSLEACRAMADRTWRLSRLRVTERRAWRFGITLPSQ
jgi:hypothetical protein